MLKAGDAVMISEDAARISHNIPDVSRLGRGPFTAAYSLAVEMHGTGYKATGWRLVAASGESTGVFYLESELESHA